MKLTPLDIRHKEFKRGMRGYADTEVDEFLDEVADEFERLFKENIDYGERVEALEEKIAHYRMIEETLQKTLLSAQQSAEELKQNATKEAQLILRDAELKTRQMVNESYADKQRVEKEMAGLRNAEDEFRFRFRSMLEGYLKQLGDIDRGAQERASEFQRQAEALKEAMAREDTLAPASEARAERSSAPKPSAQAEALLRTVEEAQAAAAAETSRAAEKHEPVPRRAHESQQAEPEAPDAPPEQRPAHHPREAKEQPAPAATREPPPRPQGRQEPPAPSEGRAPAAPARAPAKADLPPDLAPPANTGVAARRVPVEWQVSSADSGETLGGEPPTEGRKEQRNDELFPNDPEVGEDDFKW